MEANTALIYSSSDSSYACRIQPFAKLYDLEDYSIVQAAPIVDVVAHLTRVIEACVGTSLGECVCYYALARSFISMPLSKADISPRICNLDSLVVWSLVHFVLSSQTKSVLMVK